ncbi:MAG: uridine diphosphate-N-acetylglucosamine-binding protein YvcK [Chloroflexi bacterium]|nr:uridine diphosphate-N-acetylglucosamine-binding protein YvcK [Chloroflexota bacterium]MBP8056451.1 uridine diphosphate-N-acetylglucosamine-binding protein YvcK [Chloroflexota bacterium]
MTFFASLWQTLLNRSRWLSLGIGVKRWLVTLVIGAGIMGMGVVYAILIFSQQGVLPDVVYNIITMQGWPPLLRMIVALLLGGSIVFVAIVRLGRNLVAPFRQPHEDVATSLYDYTQRKRGPHIVAIGGGTGMPTLLRGLREFTNNITAIVTVADDGGSSGRLRRELGLLPPGDFRNNIAALAGDEMLMTQLMQYRFGGTPNGDEAGQLRGHAFGNLLLAALTGVTGSFEEALLMMDRVLRMRGRVLPSTLDHIILTADIWMGEPPVLTHVIGESAIPKAHGLVERVYLHPEPVRAYPPAIQAILQADLIVFGPGSLYTSILPNLLVPDLAEALRHAAAPKIYVCNLATQPGETDNYTVADHVNKLLSHLPPGCLDAVLANNNLSIPPETGGGHTLFVQPLAPATMQMVTADLVDEVQPWRHDSRKLAQAVMDLLK